VDASGADYGVIHIKPFDARILRTALTPLTPTNWKIETIEFDRYFVLGVPQATVTLVALPGKDPITTKGISLLELTPVSPEDVPDDGGLTPFQRFYFRVTSGLDNVTPPIRNIKGMSGGPLFVVDLNSKSYWVVGVQSGWWESQRIVSFCPIDDRLQQVLDGFLAAQGLATTGKKSA
jgi:hypothetical protein